MKRQYGEEVIIMNKQEIIATIESLPIQEQTQIITEWIKNQATQIHHRKKVKRLLSLLEDLCDPDPQQPSLLTNVGDQNQSTIKRRQRQEWKEAHRAEYAGKYIALDGNRLLGVGKNYVEARKAAIQAGVKDAYIDYMQPLDEEIFMGGW